MTQPLPDDAPVQKVRLDVWLFRARFVKSRGLAAGLIEKGRIRLERNGQIVRLTKPAHAIQPGDILTLPLRPAPLRVEVCTVGERRGPASEARTLYRTLDIAGP